MDGFMCNHTILSDRHALLPHLPERGTISIAGVRNTLHHVYRRHCGMLHVRPRLLPFRQHAGADNDDDHDDGDDDNDNDQEMMVIMMMMIMIMMVMIMIMMVMTIGLEQFILPS
jgi:hypothetical protein